VIDMYKRLSRYLGVFVLLTGVLCAPFAAAEKPPEVSHDGLHLVHDTKLAMVYVKPGVDFSVYKRIALLDCGIAFRKNWQRDQNQSDPFRVSKKDMDEIRTGLAALFGEIMRDELTNHGQIPLVDTADEDVLILRPAIVDLDIAVPKAADMAPGRGRTFATSAGEMTLYMELYDGATGQLIARLADREEGRDWGRMMWQNAATNRAEAERIIRGWAVTLREGFERIRTMPPLFPVSE
jgi:Protein of unknown function (DUF3313)